MNGLLVALILLLPLGVIALLVPMRKRRVLAVGVPLLLALASALCVILVGVPKWCFFGVSLLLILPFFLIIIVAMSLVLRWYMAGPAFWGSLWRSAFVFLVPWLLVGGIFCLVFAVYPVRMSEIDLSSFRELMCGLDLSYAVFNIAAITGLLRLLYPESPWVKILVMGFVLPVGGGLLFMVLAVVTGALLQAFAGH